MITLIVIPLLFGAFLLFGWALCHAAAEADRFNASEDFHKRFPEIKD